MGKETERNNSVDNNVAEQFSGPEQNIHKSAPEKQKLNKND